MGIALHLNPEHRCIRFDQIGALSAKRFENIGILLVLCLGKVAAASSAFRSVLARFVKVMLEPPGSEMVVS
jgi:hypothetical protein